ncbi:MAG: tRNA pseudouridine(38-40) synthase TruA [Vicingaceae bacterium]|nr:tRNA pseudouridine(38-40) synthase TruA [Vicingaceae bacterium]
MSRYFIELKYDGTNYHGWQIQNNANSVQAEVNKALTTLFQTEIMVMGAGRTDTGVHAQQLFAHFDIYKAIDTTQLVFKLNTLLPQDISCSSAAEVNAQAHARFSATARTYEYWITPNKNPFLINKAYHYPKNLDIALMNKAAKELQNHIDFSSFSKSNTDTHTNNCRITFAEWKQVDNKIIFTISSDRFLRNMVRAIVGTMLEVGIGKVSEDDLTPIINSKNRSNAGTSAPAHGLYLTQVNYPKEVYNV